MKLAVVGSRSFTDVELALAVVGKYIAQYGDALVIVSGAAKGADYIGKQIALKNGIKYIEYPPVHESWNEYCVLAPYNYDKPYKVSNFFERNTLIAECADHVAAFVVEGVKSNGTMDTVTKARELGKPTFVFTQTKFKGDGREEEEKNMGGGIGGGVGGRSSSGDAR